MEIRFPRVLTVANQPGGEVSQPASFWVWRNPNAGATTCDPQARLAITHDTLDLVWLEEEQEVSSSWRLPVNNRREEASPHQVFVYLAPQENLPSSAELIVMVNDTIVDQIEKSNRTNLKAIPVNLWSAWASGWFRFFNLLLGSQNLTLLAGIISIVGGIYKLFQDEQERRKQQQKEFDAAVVEFEQKASQKPEQAASEYLDLLARIRDWGLPPEQQERLRRKFRDVTRQFPQGHIWARGLRAQLAAELNEAMEGEVEAPVKKKPAWMKLAKPQNGEAPPSWPETAQKETEFLSEAQLQSLKRLLTVPAETEDLAALLRDGLQVFRALGEESKTFIARRILGVIEAQAKEARRKIQVELLTPATPLFSREILDVVKREWFEQGKAAGHYLLEQIAREQKDLRKALLEWEEADPSRPNQIRPPFGLWGNAPVYETPPEVLQLLGESHPRWKHPFGPRKAEDDPRLPLLTGKDDLRPIGGLFWEEHPLWASILSLEPCFVTASPGSGVSAMLRMGQHIRRFWGRKPALSLGLSLSGKPEMPTLWHHTERALSASVRRDLVEDPYWLLGAESFVQEWVASFFEHVYSNIWRLTSRLQEAGLPEEETDLIIALLHATERKAYHGPMQFPDLIGILRERLGEAARYRLRDDRFEVFLWVEIKDAEFTPAWLDLLRESGLLQLGIAKVFSPAKILPTSLHGTLAKYELTWTEEQLTAMLRHRCKQTGQNALLDEIRENIPQLIKSAHRSPARLIEWGNREIQALAHKK